MTERDRILHDIARDVSGGDWAVNAIQKGLVYAWKRRAVDAAPTPKNQEAADKAHDALLSALKWHDPAQAVIQ